MEEFGITQEVAILGVSLYVQASSSKSTPSELTLLQTRLRRWTAGNGSFLGALWTKTSVPCVWRRLYQFVRILLPASLLTLLRSLLLDRLRSEQCSSAPRLSLPGGVLWRFRNQQRARYAFTCPAATVALTLRTSVRWRYHYTAKSDSLHRSVRFHGVRRSFSRSPVLLFHSSSRRIPVRPLPAIFGPR